MTGSSVQSYSGCYRYAWAGDKEKIMQEMFDTAAADAQGTNVVPVSPERFDFPAYMDYERYLLDKCSSFWNSSGGTAVYRRFRVPEVYSWGCSDMKHSLDLQLGALMKSMEFKADIPNFLEPWYGIGIVSSAFGLPYIWKEGQAPVVEGIFKSAREALDSLTCPVAESPVGKHILEMIEYFLDKTRGWLPVSLTDTQSPLNIVSSYLLDSSSFMYEIYDHPDTLKKLLMTVAEMEHEFLLCQEELIGDSLVKPGHGFASARCFDGIGFSDDNILMFSDDMYNEFALEPLAKAAEGFIGTAFHSCGNWSPRTEVIKGIPGLCMVDGAVGNLTDPSPNDPELLGEAFRNTGVVLHTRIVGSPGIVAPFVPLLKKEGMRNIFVTYCETPEEQEFVYTLLHERERI